MVRKIIISFFLFFGVVQSVLGQAEIVPASHEVYRFLHLQRVAGILPEYHDEVKPVSRGKIQSWLRLLNGHTLSGNATFWLREFEREFFEPDSLIERVFQPVHLPIGIDTEKYFYHKQDSTWRFAFEGSGALQVRNASSDSTYQGLSLNPIITLQGNYKKSLGFYMKTMNGSQYVGNLKVLRFDPEIQYLYKVSEGTLPAGSFDLSTASLQYENEAVSFEIGHEGVQIGTSFSTPLILGMAGGYFSFVRFGLVGRTVNYQMIHGALGDKSFWVQPENENESSRLEGLQRYLALHRFSFQPNRRVQLAFTEMVVYGLRSPEFAYLNPLFPIKVAEHELWDRDNSLLALDGVWRPTPKLELNGTFLIDDFVSAKIGSGSVQQKWGLQYGIGYAASDVLFLSYDYTRLEPHVYTHRFQKNGIFYNSYQHNQSPLGHPIGPNADQWRFGAEFWLPKRIRGFLSAHYSRRGENYFDSEGEFVNVGGDLYNGSFENISLNNDTKVFLQGERFSGYGATFQMEYEPINDWMIKLVGDFTNWDHGIDRRFTRIELMANF